MPRLNIVLWSVLSIILKEIYVYEIILKNNIGVVYMLINPTYININILIN